MDGKTYWTGAQTEAGLLHYWQSVDRPHRALWVQTIADLGPSSVLEVGCHCGPNLRLLREALPDAALRGIDPCAEAIAFGRAQPELAGIELSVGSATEAASADVVATCYALAYVEPDGLADALRALWAATGKHLVLLEPMAFQPGQMRELRNGDYVEWCHPYLHALSQLPECAGASALVREVEYPRSRLSGLIVLSRPV